jgi:hypothetical protein
VTTEIVQVRKTVTLTLDDYMKLFRASCELTALENAGIDSWDGFDTIDNGAILNQCTTERMIRANTSTRLTLSCKDIPDELWNAILVKVEQLKAKVHYLSAVRDPCFYSADGRTAICTVDFSVPDGTTTTYIIKASYNVKRSITLHVNAYYGVNEVFWDQIVNNAGMDRFNAIVVGDHCYSVTPDSAMPGSGDGYGGARFEIEWLSVDGEPTGETFVTHNLWSRGVVPPSYRHRLVANARFVEHHD